MKFVIYSPSYSRHCGGIKALHRLGWILKQKGHDVTLAWGKGINLEEPIPLYKGDKNAIVIYPEIIPDNPLGISKVVRWLLAPIGQDWQDARRDGLMFSWTKIWNYPYVEELYVPIVDERYFNLNNIGERTLILSYKTSRIPGDIEITDYYPDSWDKLADLLHKAKYFRSGDNMTCLLLETKLCGCPVVLVGYGDTGFDPNLPITYGMTASEDGIEFARNQLPQFYEAYHNYKEIGYKSVDNFIQRCQEKWG